MGHRFGGFGLDENNKIYNICEIDPFQVPKNDQNKHEITEEEDKTYNELKDYEVFAI